MSPKLLNQLVGLALLAIVLVAGGSIYSCGRRSKEAENLRAENAERMAQIREDSLAIEGFMAALDSLRASHVERAETAYVYRTRYDSIRDTIRIPATMLPLVESADSTIAACFLALETCGERAETADSLAAAERRMREHWQAVAETYRRMIPTAFERTRRDVIAGAVGASVGYTACALTQ